MADYGRSAFCCQRLSAEELNDLADEGRPVSCATCEYAARQDALWPQNVEAYTIYRALCGRTVQVLDLHGWLFLALTQNMGNEERLDMLARLDVIHAVLSPDERTERDDDGRRADA